MKETIQLTDRLTCVSQMVCGTRVADIGTDHGKLLIHLAQTGKLLKGIGSDIANGPASACRKNIAAFGLSNVIQVRVGDGLATLMPGEIDTIVLAGMGGELILNILRKHPEIAHSASELIVQPMTNVKRFLEGLPALEFQVVQAKLAKEKQKMYQIFKIRTGKVAYTKAMDFVICPSFAKENDPLLSEFLNREYNKYKKRLDGIRRASVQDEAKIKEIEMLIEEMKNYEVRNDSSKFR